MRERGAESGYTLVELLVAMFVFALVSTGFYQVVIAQTRSVETARATSRIGEEARVGFNRMVRDTREADIISAASGTSYTIKVNYNADALYQNPNANGDNEILTFAYDAAAKTVTLNGEVLMSGVEPVVITQPMFDFTSNALEYDWNNDGTTTWEEIDQASCASQGVTGVGDCDTPPTLDAGEFRWLTGVEFNIKDSTGTTTFYATAQLRNKV